MTLLQIWPKGPLLALGAVLSVLPAGRAAELYGPEKGLVWMVAPLEKTINPVGDPAASNRQAMVGEMEHVLSTNPCLSAVFLNNAWKDVEPEPDRYDWSLLDAEVAVAHGHGKAFKLLFHPGTDTPEWVYAQGAEAFPTTISNPYRSNFGARIDIPLPWDETYLRAYDRLLAKVAERYGGDRSFVAITLSGVNFMSNEMHLPNGKEDMERWKSYPDYPLRIVGTYRRLIDTYAALFPHQQVTLHISVPLPDMDEQVAEIIRYGAEKYPGQFTLQNCQLNGRSDDSDVFSYKFVLEYDGRLRHGFQDVSGWLNAKEPQGSMEMTVFNLVHAHGEYLELFPGDGADPAICAQVMKQWESARQMGWQAYEAQLKSEGKYIPPKS